MILQFMTYGFLKCGFITVVEDGKEMELKLLENMSQESAKPFPCLILTPEMGQRQSLHCNMVVSDLQRQGGKSKIARLIHVVTTECGPWSPGFTQLITMIQRQKCQTKLRKIYLHNKTHFHVIHVVRRIREVPLGI